MRYFFLIDDEGYLLDMQVSEGDGARLWAKGYIEVTRARYMTQWQYRIARRVAQLLKERTV